MTANDSVKRALQESLTQLANSFQANEEIITDEQVAECFEHLQATHRTALERLFSLIYQNGHVGSTSPPPPGCSVRRVSRRTSCGSHAARSTLRNVQAEAPLASRPSTTLPTTNARRSDADSRLGDVAVHAHDHRRQRRKKNDELLPTTTRVPLSSPAEAQQGLPDFRGLALTFPGSDESDNSDRLFIIDITFPATIDTLLQTCISDPSAFLRAVRDGKVSLPNGQGWEAAIATKSNNADLRDLTRIFHRFECHNIYQHVVEAGYHTGSHWIRDMRALLAERLCRDFPARFIDQKAANKSLLWVDQGCRYREWAEKLSGATLDLGYLIALPCNVPHSTYTSRCTKEQIIATVIELKRLGIDKVVERIRLSALASHIVKSLQEMTVGERADSVIQSPPSIQPRYAVPFDDSPSSLTCSECVLAHPELTMLDVSQCTFDAFEDAWLEEGTGQETCSSTLEAPMAVETISTFRPFTVTRTDLPSPATSSMTVSSPSIHTDRFNEWYQQ